MDLNHNQLFQRDTGMSNTSKQCDFPSSQLKIAAKYVHCVNCVQRALPQLHPK